MSMSSFDDISFQMAFYLKCPIRTGSESEWLHYKQATVKNMAVIIVNSPYLTSEKYGILIYSRLELNFELLDILFILKFLVIFL